MYLDNISYTAHEFLIPKEKPHDYKQNCYTCPGIIAFTAHKFLIHE